MSRMDCGGNADLLVAFAAGRLDAAARADLEKHLQACPACREIASGQRAVWAALDGWEPAAISPDFDRVLYRRIAGEVSWWDRVLRPFRPTPFRGWPIAAAVGLVLVTGIAVDRSITVKPATETPSIQMESLRPDQVESALEDMEMLQEINGLVRPDSAESTM